ncbi:MAG: phosphoribosylformylglycinamidine cyclo-ligase, partial [Oscillospiraceae bacterium]|nr:phosphoribosylformylglycinamidine cyclo-ligase [Oscillospiraceae bacterium]
FNLIARTGHIPERDMFNTFNMGVGMILSVAQEDADKAVRVLTEAGEDAYILGELVASDEGVILE